MKYFLPLFFLFFCACASKPPNDVVCFVDADQEANCTYMVQGTDFKVDNAGHNYILGGHNYSFDKIERLFFLVPPETYADIKNFFIVYCNQNPGVCTYQTVMDNAYKIESRLKQNMTEDQKIQFEQILRQKLAPEHSN